MNRIKELRLGKHLTQEKLGEFLHVQKAAISKYENGRATPSTDILKKLSHVFDVSTDYILGVTDTPAAEPHYYNDPEVAEIANELKNNPGARVLFDAGRELSKESIEEVKKFIEFQKAKEGLD